MKQTTVKNIIAAKRYFAQYPEGKINTGIWKDPTWNKEEFYKWFRKCLNIKTGGAALTDKDFQIIRDARIINDYQKGTRHSGMNVLNTTRFKRLYPHINNQINND